MKLLVVLLIAANLAFYAFGAGYLGRFTDREPARLVQQVNPASLKILAVDEERPSADAVVTDTHPSSTPSEATTPSTQAGQ